MISLISRRPAYPALILCLIIALAAAMVISTGMGFIYISPMAVLRIILDRLTSIPGLIEGIDPLFSYVVMDVRLPRIITSSAVGGGLAVCGVLFQGILLNPLADPYTLGISSGAAFGASIALLSGIVMGIILPVQPFAFAGAAIALVAVIHLSSFDGHVSPDGLILSGVIVSAILAAAISLMKYMADEQVGTIVFWLMGSFASRTWSDALIVSSAFGAGLGVSIFFGRDLNIMSMGIQVSDSLGVATSDVRKILLVTASLVTAICVSVSGIIGFVGLIIPHLMRFLIGPDNSRLIPASALGGAILLLIADTISRALLPIEIPIGILTSLMGGLFFCLIFRKSRRGSGHVSE